MLTNMKVSRGVVFSLAAVLGAITLAGCAPSLESAADECGGRPAGIIADETAIVVDVSYGPEALTCITGKLFPSDADQYSVAATADAGAPQVTTIGGRSVKVVEMDGSTLVVIGAD